jgi:raffinose/stachyose/melibiose transport system permease protein
MSIRKPLTELSLWLICAIFFSPIVFVVLNSFKDFKEIVISPLSFPSSFALTNFRDAWTFTSYHQAFMNSALSTLGIILLCSMAGYKLARTATTLSGFLFAVIMLAMMVPFQTIMIPIAQVAKSLSLLNNIWTLPILYTGYSCSLAVLLYHGFTKGIPIELEEAAIMDGCSSFRIFTTIIFPLFKPLTSTVAVIYVMTFWNDLLIPLIMITKKSAYTIPLSQMMFYGHFTTTDWNLLLACAVMSSLPILLLYAVLQKHVIGGLIAGAVKS